VNDVIILGSGHLAVRVSQELEKRGYRISHLSTEIIESSPDYQTARLDSIRGKLHAARAETAKAIYVVDSEDRRNIEFALAAMSLNDSRPIFLALFNEKIAPHFQINSSNLFIMNPARIAAASFVDAISISRDETPRAVPEIPPGSDFKPGFARWFSDNKLLVGLLFAFVVLYFSGAFFFHTSEGLRWVDAFYFVTTVITTTGFGDINLRNSSDAAKIFAIGMMLTSISFFSIAFALVVDKLMERRSEIMRGRTRHKLRGHTILCGLGRVGFQVAGELIRRGHAVVIIENDEQNRFLSTVRARGAKVLFGDATLLRNLEFAGLRHAAGLISVINDDLTNLEVGLHARSLDPGARLILRIFDRDTATEVSKRLNIQFAFSTSAIAAEEIVRKLDSTDE